MDRLELNIREMLATAADRSAGAVHAKVYSENLINVEQARCHVSWKGVSILTVEKEKARRMKTQMYVAISGKSRTWKGSKRLRES